MFKNSTKYSGAFILPLVLLASGFSHAQTLTELPPGADVGQIPRPSDPTSDRDHFSDIAQPDQEKPTIRAPDLSPDLAEKTFTLQDIRMQGATAFSEPELQKIYGGDIGNTITVKRLFEILAEIQKLYYDAGFTLSKVFIPVQDIQSGYVTFQVAEGYIADLQIDPLITETPIINAFRENVLSMKPLNVLKLERMLLILNDRPGISVASVLSPLGDEQSGDLSSYPLGAVRLTLKKTETKPSLGGFLEWNNHGSNYSGPHQFTGGIILDERLPNYSDMLAYYSQTASPHEMRQAGLEYTLPLGGISGVNANFRISTTATEPGHTLDVLDVRGRSFTYGLGISYPIIRQRDQTLRVGADFSYKNAYTDLMIEPLFRDRIRTMGWNINYAFSDRWNGLNICNLGVVQGLNILGAQADPARDTSRAEGKSSFTKTEFSAARLQGITERLSLTTSLKGQQTNTPLLSGEEFGFGGARTGRGYDYSEITGDNGVSASFELRLSDVLGGPFTSSDLYTFYDIGKVWNIDPLTKDKISAASFGVGLRGQLPAGLGFDFMIALPTTKSIEDPPQYTNRDGPRVLFSLRKEFNSGL